MRSGSGSGGSAGPEGFPRSRRRSSSTPPGRPAPTTSGNTKLSLPVFVRLTEVLQVSADELLQGEPSAQRARAEGAILSLLDSCSLTQLQILQDVLCSVKQALDVRLEK